MIDYIMYIIKIKLIKKIKYDFNGIRKKYVKFNLLFFM